VGFRRHLTAFSSGYRGAVAGTRTFDVVIVGSGFGGSVAAHRLTEKGYSVCVLESGKRWASTDFPKTNWDVRRSLWFPRLGMLGIQRISLLRDIMILSGVGVGGGSLVYANTHYEPHPAFYTDPQWAGIADWRAELEPWFDTARTMLGVVENPNDTAADGVIHSIAQHFDVDETYQRTPVAVYFGEPGVAVEDPYFGGSGPGRSGCIGCGNCMVGCRHEAKNTLDKNYLWFAERNGAVVEPLQQVVDVRRVGARWEVTAKRPGWRRASNVYSADQVIFSGGALGTTRLLLELVERGRLPNISERLGYQTRTNSEALVGAVARRRSVDYSKGVAITSSIHLASDTHIEPVRYGKGSNVLGLLSTILVDGGPGAPRQLKFLRSVLRHPIRFLRSLSVWHWSERSVILLVMQSRDNSLRLLRRRRLMWSRLTSEQGHGDPNPSYIPEANDAARVAATIMGGDAMGSINEVLFDTPTTAHILGGAPIGATPADGVIDAYHRVFGHDGLHVVDGAAIGANLGVNPALTITAMAERAMSMWPVKGQPDKRPALGDSYRAG
jgi:cholesterol oxidase